MIVIFIFFLKASKRDQYLSVGVNDIILQKSSIELQPLQSVSQLPESLASVSAEDNAYAVVSPLQAPHPANVIKKEVVEMITKTTTRYIYIYRYRMYIYI